MSKSAKIFIANLSSKVRESDLEDMFERFGKIRDIIIKESRERFAFVEFDHWRDADDAVRKKNGTELFGRKLRIEVAHGDRRKRDDSLQRKSHCLVCNEKGHWAKDCPKGDGLSIRDGKCFNCGGRGHKKKDCPKGSPRGKRSASKSRSRSRSRSKDRRRGSERRRSPRYSRSRSQEKRKSSPRNDRRRSKSSSQRRNSRSKSEERKAGSRSNSSRRRSRSP